MFNVVQSIHDLPGGTALLATKSDPGDQREPADLLASHLKPAMVVDEFHMLLSPAAHESNRKFAEGVLAAGARP